MKSSKRTHTLPRLVAAFLTLTAFGVGTAHSCYFTDDGCGVQGVYGYTASSTSTFISATAPKTGGSGEGYGVTTSGESTTYTTSQGYYLDNNGNTELLAIKLSTSDYLDRINFGYWGADADFSVFAWVGAGALTPAGGITGSTVGSLATTATSGWKLVGNYQDTGSNLVWDSTNNMNVSQVDVNNGATPVTSTWWIISAYNSAYGGNSLGDTTSDYMKVLGVACAIPTTPPGRVSEPASLFMLGAGLIGMMALRRRRQS